MKTTFQKILVRRVILLHTSANLFILWPHRRQLDSLICFCMQSVAVCLFG